MRRPRPEGREPRPAVLSALDRSIGRVCAKETAARGAELSAGEGSYPGAQQVRLCCMRASSRLDAPGGQVLENPRHSSGDTHVQIGAPLREVLSSVHHRLRPAVCAARQRRVFRILSCSRKSHVGRQGRPLLSGTWVSPGPFVAGTKMASKMPQGRTSRQQEP